MTRSHRSCLTCGRPLDGDDDPLSADCGGDCWGCVGACEIDDPLSRDKIQAEIALGLRRPDGSAVLASSDDGASPSYRAEAALPLRKFPFDRPFLRVAGATVLAMISANRRARHEFWDHVRQDRLDGKADD